MLLEFLRTGRLGKISLKKTVFECKLDEPQSIFVDKNISILKFGSLELIFNNGRLWSIGIEFEPEYFDSKYVVDFHSLKNISIDNFILYLEKNGIPSERHPLFIKGQTSLIVGDRLNASYELTASFEIENKQSRLWGIYCKDTSV